MPGHDLIVVGASAGGVEALSTLVAGLPADLAATVCIVLHIPPTATSLLPMILGRAGPLPVSAAQDGAPLRQGQVYVAPPDHHLLIESGYLRVVRGPRENRSRPAIDPMFRTAARSYGPRVIGVVLTGALDDGTVGLRAIKERGGIAIVQDPADAYFPDMPRSALRNVAVDYRLPVAAMGAVLAVVAREPAPPDAAFPLSPELEIESRIAEREMGSMEENQMLGIPSAFACPECHGTLWEVHDGDLVRYRCRVGHAYSAESMLAEHTDSLEAALWAALRALEESAALTRRLAIQAESHHQHRAAARFGARAAEREEHAAVLREVLRKNGASTLVLQDDPEDEAS
jgi:two-component system chemotaxis response regulator CheB